jgi:transposase
MNIHTRAGIQKIIDIEVILIIIGLGADIFIQTLRAHDWIAGAIIIAGLALMAAVYWHTLHIDRLAHDVREASSHLLHPHANEHTTVITPPVIPLPAAASPAAPQSASVPYDVPLSAVSDRPVLHVSNFLLSKNFYGQTLAILGYKLILEFPALSMASFGTGRDADLWIKGDGTKQKIRASFRADSESIVDDFFNTALDMGGIEAESPSLRPEKGIGYYSAAVYDPDGSTVEAFVTEVETNA